MKIISCCKLVPEEENIVVLANREISTDKAPWKIGTYDLNALEAGKNLAAETGGSMVALTVGGSELSESKLRKDILSRGPASLAVVMDDEHARGDSFMMAKALAASLTQMGEYDLVLCGTGSADLYAQQVGNQLGALLDLPVVNAVSKLSYHDNVLVVERSLENEVEVLEVPLPAVISVTSDINIPAIPGMKDIMGAGKKPVTELTVDWGQIASTSEKCSEVAPEQKERKMEILEGESDEVIDALVQFLKKELV